MVKVEVQTESDSPISLSTASPVEESDDRKIDTKDQEVEQGKSITTCKPINVTEPTQPSVDKSRSTVKVSSTASPISSTTKATVRSTAKLSKEVSTKSATTSTTTEPPTTLPKDNSTETSEFKEKISYSGSNIMEKNDTIDDETVVDNGVLPTEEEEEEKRKDELESKQKIASFFGVDPVTGKERDDKLNPLISERQNPRGKSYNLESDLMTRAVSNVEPPPKQSNKWFLGNQPFARGDRDYAANNKPKEDEFLYHPMLKLLYRNCYGNCS